MNEDNYHPLRIGDIVRTGDLFLPAGEEVPRSMDSCGRILGVMALGSTIKSTDGGIWFRPVKNTVEVTTDSSIVDELEAWVDNTIMEHNDGSMMSLSESVIGGLAYLAVKNKIGVLRKKYGIEKN